MALTDTFVRQVKPTAGARKYQDGDGMYLLVKVAGKYWRYDYRFNGKRKTAALGNLCPLSATMTCQAVDVPRRAAADEPCQLRLRLAVDQLQDSFDAVITKLDRIEAQVDALPRKTSRLRFSVLVLMMDIRVMLM